MMSAAGGGGPEVEDVFSIYTYKGTGSSQTITNNIDLSTEGGMVWIKNRDSSSNHAVTDTVRNWPYHLVPNSNIAEETSVQNVTGFTTSGFTLGTNALVNNNNTDFVSWTFRNQEKFFTHVKYTGDGTSSRNISHDLNHTVGFIAIKCMDTNHPWVCYHRELGATKYFSFDSSGSPNTSSTHFNNTAPTSTQFTVGSNDHVNESGRNYMAYIWAHHNNDGGFGASGDKDIQKMGSYVGNNTDDRLINVGFEPQFVILRSQYSGNWIIIDSMRGSQVFGDYPCNNLYVDTTDSTQLSGTAGMHSQGFVVNGANQVNFNNTTFYWWAIRKGTKIAETVGEVFNVDESNNSDNPAFESNFPVDFAYYRDKNTNGSNWIVGARKVYKSYWNFNTRNTKSTLNNMAFDYPNDWYDGTQDANHVSGMWRESTGVFGTAWWKTDGTGNQTIQHNLGAVPEMIWSKSLQQNGYGEGSWFIAHHDLTGWDSSNENDRHTFQDFTTAASGQQGYHRDFTDTSIRLLGNAAGGYVTNKLCFAALFATSPGISKVGSYTGNGASSQNIDCGFSNGTQWVLIKRYDATGNWLQFDTARGINVGNDPYLQFNRDYNQSSDDIIDSYSGGFAVTNNATGALNVSNGKYIFLAYAAP